MRCANNEGAHSTTLVQPCAALQQLDHSLLVGQRLDKA